MVRVNIKTGEIIEAQEFKGGKAEKQLQNYVEKYLDRIFRCYFLERFYKIPGGEIDTLTITEDRNPCIIEYKRKKDDTIINQIVYYYDWLKQRATKFEFERIIKENDNTKNLDVDWSQIRLICVAKEYSKRDISLIKHLDTKIECYSYTYHKDELDIHLDPIVNQFIKQEDTRKTQTRELTLEDHRNRANEETKRLLDKLREEVFKLGDDIEERYAPNYIKYSVNTNFLAIYIRKKWLILELKVNEKIFSDPKKITKNTPWKGWKKVKIQDIDELDYILKLIRQAYKHQHE